MNIEKCLNEIEYLKNIIEDFDKKIEEQRKKYEEIDKQVEEYSIKVEDDDENDNEFYYEYEIESLENEMIEIEEYMESLENDKKLTEEKFDSLNRCINNYNYFINNYKDKVLYKNDYIYPLNIFEIEPVFNEYDLIIKTIRLTDINLSEDQEIGIRKCWHSVENLIKDVVIVNELKIDSNIKEIIENLICFSASYKRKQKIQKIQKKIEINNF